jgi:hypothetical protein
MTIHAPLTDSNARGSHARVMTRNGATLAVASRDVFSASLSLSPLGLESADAGKRIQMHVPGCVCAWITDVRGSGEKQWKRAQHTHNGPVPFTILDWERCTLFVQRAQTP